MPIAHAFSEGLANGNSKAFPLALPSLEGQAVEIDRISIVRGSGRLLADGDQILVGLSHQVDLQTTTLLDDQDDFLQDNGYDLWWVHGLSETDHVTDDLDTPEQVAGPQTILFFNGSGATAAIRVDVTFHLARLPNLTRWALLKQLTSYETQL